MQRPTTETDRQLREAVLEHLNWEPDVESGDISVAARGGVITLTGFVHTYAEKRSAERAAKSVYGVQAVANDLEVKLGTSRSDPEIARDTVQAMKLNATVPKENITVTVSDGFITLEGVVERQYQSTAAENCVRDVAGVRGITNLIKVKPKPIAVSAEVIRSQVEEALKRSADIDARRITVSADDSTVALYGNVRSWFEREAAERIAWAAPGVTKVRDRINVVP